MEFPDQCGRVYSMTKRKKRRAPSEPPQVRFVASVAATAVVATLSRILYVVFVTMGGLAIGRRLAWKINDKMASRSI
ncbi:hypothetical protein [Fundidesulfovibrio butyratiphilus]